MKKNNIILLAVVAFLFSCNVTPEKSEKGDNSQTGNQIVCDNDIRSYEFGREMASFKEMFNLTGFEDAIAHYNSSTGMNLSSMMENECALKGYNDGILGINDPYNKDGKAWTEFK